MKNVISLLNMEPVSEIELNDILLFIACYPEWLSKTVSNWPDITKLRSHLFKNQPLEEKVKINILEIFLSDLIIISLAQVYVFPQFTIIHENVPLYTKYLDCEVDHTHLKRISINLSLYAQGRDISGVGFLINMLREVIE